MASSALLERRVEAAVASRGTSAEPIYRTARALAGELRLAGDLLEFGAGSGTLLSGLSRQGSFGTLTGADILRRPVGIPDSAVWIQADLNDPLPCPDRSFDVIVSTEVIEHLENPRAAFREFSRLLRPRGSLLLSTPNQESLRSLAALVLRGHFVDFLDSSYPAHLTALVRRDFSRLCAETGFTPPSFHYTAHGAVPGWTVCRWQDVSLGLLRGRLFSDNVFVSTTRSACESRS